MDLARLLAARRKEKESLIKKPPAYETVFSPYERNVLASVDSDKKSQKYSDMYLNTSGQRVPQGWGEPQSSYVKEGMTGRELWEAERMQKQAEAAGPKKYTGPDRSYETSKDYVDNLIDESDRWKKTGSRWVTPTTSATRRDTHMGKLYRGTMPTMTGVLGGVSTKKKKLLGK